MNIGDGPSDRLLLYTRDESKVKDCGARTAEFCVRSKSTTHVRSPLRFSADISIVLFICLRVRLFVCLFVCLSNVFPYFYCSFYRPGRNASHWTDRINCNYVRARSRHYRGTNIAGVRTIARLFFPLEIPKEVLQSTLPPHDARSERKETENRV